jgi:dUTP pyrophosphatase
MIQFCKRSPNAVIPTRAGPLEAGFDLTLIEYEKPVAINSFMFDTGIAVQPPSGYFCVVVPRSSIVKNDVILTNSMGVIDPTYTGSIKVVLSEVSQGSIENLLFKLPIKLCQLIFLPLLPPVQVLEVQAFEATSRNDGGFGSTDGAAGLD